tara:strand:- start:6700 stop:7512 length:813 start_codon:yes stop_codon:yes gene_type:complete
MSLLEEHMLRRRWKVLDGLWFFSGYFVTDTDTLSSSSSLTRDQKLFAFQFMWEEKMGTDFIDPHFSEGLCFLRLSDKKPLTLGPSREDRDIKQEIAQAMKIVTDLKKQFEKTANTNYCEIWFEVNKPFHLLSEWRKDYLMHWIVQEEIDIPWSGNILGSNFETQTKQDHQKSNGLMKKNKGKKWKVKEIVRDKEYALHLKALLADFCERGRRPPSALEVLNAWKKNLPWGIYEVNQHGFRYKLKSGRKSDIIPVRYLTKAIERRIVWSDD